MRKHVTLLLSAALALGTVTAVAAPVMKSARAAKSMLPDKFVDVSQIDERTVLDSRRMLAPLSANGFFQVVSTVEAQNRLAVKSATAAHRALGSSLELAGQVGVSNDLTQYSFYKIPTVAGGAFESLFTCSVPFNYGGVFNQDANTWQGIYANISGSSFGAYFHEIDLATLTVTRSVEVPFEKIGLLAISVAKDPVSGRNYGFFYNDNASGFVWGYIDYDNLTRTAIAEFETYCPAIGATADGKYYGMTEDGKLVSIDKATGAMSSIGQTPVPYKYTFAGCIDTVNNNMLIYAVEDDLSASSLYEVNLATAETSKLVTYPLSQMLSLYTIATASDKVPVAPELTLEAPNGSMTVSYTITIPTTLVDGTPVTGALDWSIALEGETKFEGRNMAGTSVSGDITVDRTGWLSFTATASNADGRSAKKEVKIFVGNGLPAAPVNVAASWADGTMSLSWDAVTGSSDGGYVDPSAVTYIVTDAVSGQVLTQSTTATSTTYEVAAPDVRTGFRYAVSAVFDGMEGPAAMSNEVYLGAYGTPYQVSFGKTTDFTNFGFTVLDANEDKKTWTATVDGARYSYSNKNAADDWLFTPAIWLERGKVYEFTIQICGSSSNAKEQFEVKLGSDATAEAMTGQVLPATTFSSVKSKPLTFTGFVAPENTGRHFLGVHEISPKNLYNVYVKSISLSEGMDPATPAAPTALTLTADVGGDLLVNGSVTAPTQTVTGVELTANVDLKVYRGSDLVTTVSAAPGAVANFTDRVPVKDTYTYTVVASNGGVDGKSISAEAYVGPYPAKAPTNAVMFETYQPGTVTVVWEGINQDVFGNPIAPENVSYMIYEADGYRPGKPMLDAPVKTTTATFQAIEDVTKQDFCQFLVTAFNRDQESTSYTCLTNAIPVGTPYQMPFMFTSADDLSRYVMAISRSLNTVQLGFTTNEAFDGMASAQDNDNSFFSMKMAKKSQWGEITSAKIDLTATERPELSFYIFKLEDDDVNTLSVSILHDGTSTEVFTTDMSGLQARAWNKVRINLDSYKGKNIQFAMRGTCVKYNYILLDNIRLQEVPEKDLRITGINAPVNVKINEPFNISVFVANDAYAAATGFNVNLYRDGEVVDTRSISALDPDEELQVVFDNVIAHFDNDNTQASFSAEVEFDGDSDLSNNVSKEVAVIRPTNEHPAVADLAAEQKEDGVYLTWTPYVVPEVVEPAEATEDVESGVLGEQALGDWTMLDVDGQGIGTFEGLDIPGIATHDAATFFVFDVAALGLQDNTTVTPASGSKFLGSFPNYDYYANDDWAISPLLPGCAQHISFYAKSYNKWLPTDFEILYTTENSVNPADYVKLASYKEISDAWTKYEADLPEGALHFAIRHCGIWACLLMIDDITFTWGANVKAYDLLGHDIYRDGVKINAAPVTGGEYVDTETLDGKHIYHVVTRFATGESDLSNPASVETTGLELVNASALKVYTADGNIIVEGAAGMNVTIATVDGKVLYTAAGDAKVAVAPAVYLVTVNNTTTKLLVK